VCNSSGCWLSALAASASSWPAPFSCSASRKWLQAGVLENGRHHRPASGTPQGGVISPLLANVYLHEVLDLLGFTHYWGKSRRGASVIKRWYHEGTASPCPVCDVAVVSWPSPRSDRGAACSAESAASRALCVLRDNRERAVAGCLPTHGAADLAQMEALAVEQGTQDVGVVESAH
jgi:hypothetical protein